MASLIYNSFKKDLMDAQIAMTVDTIKVALVTVTYVADKDLHTKFSDVTNEVVGTGYTAGGATLTTPTVTQDNTNDKGVFDADDVTWAASTITARGAVVYKDTGLASTSNLIAYIDFAADKTSTSGNFTITWDATGIVSNS